MDDADRQASILSSIGYDFRQVAGPLDAEPVARRRDRGRRAHDPASSGSWPGARSTCTPPTGFFRDLVVERKGEHAGRLDVKHGGITIVNNLARV